jgi:hypothetical protein
MQNKGKPMSKAYESFKRGLGEAIEFAEGIDNGTKIHKFPSVDVKRLRLKTEMTPSNSQRHYAKTNSAK